MIHWSGRRWAAASITLPIPADATTTRSRSTAMRRRPGASPASSRGGTRRELRCLGRKRPRGRFPADARSAGRLPGENTTNIDGTARGTSVSDEPGARADWSSTMPRFRASPTRWSTRRQSCGRSGSTCSTPSRRAWTETELRSRFARADRYLRDAGVFYRVYGDRRSAERAWPLSARPGADRRARMGGRRTGLDPARRAARSASSPTSTATTGWSQDGLLPPALIAANPNSCARWSASSRPAAISCISVAFEIGRGPGRQLVGAGRPHRAPSGAGFALENRVATTRAFSDIYAETPCPPPRRLLRRLPRCAADRSQHRPTTASRS